MLTLFRGGIDTGQEASLMVSVSVFCMFLLKKWMRKKDLPDCYLEQVLKSGFVIAQGCVSAFGKFIFTSVMASCGFAVDKECMSSRLQS